MEKTYVIKWDAGYGESIQLIKARSLEQAEAEAYEAWKDEAENNQDTGSAEELETQEAIDEVIEKYGEDFIDDLRDE